jgi:hypothetical protein
MIVHNQTLLAMSHKATHRGTERKIKTMQFTAFDFGDRRLGAPFFKTPSGLECFFTISLAEEPGCPAAAAAEAKAALTTA